MAAAGTGMSKADSDFLLGLLVFLAVAVGLYLMQGP